MFWKLCNFLHLIEIKSHKCSPNNHEPLSIFWLISIAMNFILIVSAVFLLLDSTCFVYLSKSCALFSWLHLQMPKLFVDEIPPPKHSNTPCLMDGNLTKLWNLPHIKLCIRTSVDFILHTHLLEVSYQYRVMAYF